MKLVALDFDGTLVSCAERHCRLMAYCARNAGITLDVAEFWSLKRAGDSNLRALDKLGCDSRLRDLLCSAWQRDIERWPWLGFDQPLSGINDLLWRLREHGVAIVLLSARTQAVFLHQQLHRLGLADSFTTVQVVRPTFAVRDKAAWLAKMRPDVWVGDSETDALAAELAGCPFCAVSSGMRSEDYWKRWFEAREDTNSWTLAADAASFLRTIVGMEN